MTISKRVRVLVVEDSLTVRRHLCEILAGDPGFEVVGEAEDGKSAIEMCLRLQPDVITLDMMLPVMTGVAVTEYIMAHRPTPILVVSASTNRGELYRTYDALAAGAVDVLDKPSGDELDGEWAERFRRTVRLVSRIRVITHPLGRLRGVGAGRPRVEPAEPTAAGTPRVVAIGTSTGGPAALVDLLRVLPAPFPLPILVVLHIGGPFGSAFAEWLDGQTQHRVSFAAGGEVLERLAGRVVMAPPDRHLEVIGGRLRVSDGAERHSCRPSVDVLFESLARDTGASTTACLLTGMGRDGALGLLDIRHAGGTTLAQDEESSVVYGMPREAARIGAAQQILPLSGIGTALSAIAHRVRRGPS